MKKNTINANRQINILYQFQLLKKDYFAILLLVWLKSSFWYENSYARAKYSIKSFYYKLNKANAQCFPLFIETFSQCPQGINVNRELLNLWKKNSSAIIIIKEEKTPAVSLQYNCESNKDGKDNRFSVL